VINFIIRLLYNHKTYADTPCKTVADMWLWTFCRSCMAVSCPESRGTWAIWEPDWPGWWCLGAHSGCLMHARVQLLTLTLTLIQLNATLS